MQTVFMLLMLAIAVVGLYVSKKLDHTYVWWVRAFVSMPAMSALFTLGQVWCCTYIAFEADIFRAVAMLCAYAVVASRFSSRPWLDIRVKDQ